MFDPLETIQPHVETFNAAAQLAALSLRISAKHTDTWINADGRTDTWITVTLSAAGFSGLKYGGSPTQMTELILALTHVLLITDFERTLAIDTELSN